MQFFWSYSRPVDCEELRAVLVYHLVWPFSRWAESGAVPIFGLAKDVDFYVDTVVLFDGRGDV